MSLKIIFSVTVFVFLLISIHTIFVVKRDGGWACTIDWEFIPDIQLSHLPDKREKNLAVNFSYATELVYGLGNVEINMVPGNEAVVAYIGIENEGDITTSVALSMAVKSEGVIAKPIALRRSVELAREIENSHDVALSLPGGGRDAAIFYFDYGLFDKKASHQTLELTVFVGEVTANDELITRHYTRHRRAYNCALFGPGHSFEPG